MRKRSKHIPTESYLFIAIHLANFMMRNLRGPVRTQNMSTQNMSNYKISTKKMSNLHVCSKD